MSIELNNASRYFGDFAAVNQVSFSLSEGITALLGPNGAGKSTLFRLIAGLDKASHGTVRVSGVDPYHQHDKVAERMGIAPEHNGHLDKVSADYQLELFAQMQGVPAREVKARVQQALSFVDLQAVGSQQAGTYSKGMRKRLAIARAIVHQPDYLLLDEPTAGLDPEQVMLLRERLLELKTQGCCIFFNSHHLSEVAYIADRIMVMNHSKMLCDESVEVFLARAGNVEGKAEQIQQAYRQVLVDNRARAVPVAIAEKG